MKNSPDGPNRKLEMTKQKQQNPTTNQPTKHKKPKPKTKDSVNFKWLNRNYSIQIEKKKKIEEKSTELQRPVR